MTLPDTLYDRAAAAAQHIAARSILRPRIAIVLGSGLASLADQLDSPTGIPFAEIPHFPQPTVPGHPGRLLLGTLAGIPVAVLQGRVHGYEGYTPEQVTFPVRVLARLGIHQLILTNAAGGINPAFHPGQLVVIADHINGTGQNPAAGCFDERCGPRFFDMSEAYSARLRRLAHHAAQAMQFRLDEGVYLAVSGPSFETPAEIRAFRTLGADLVGMSTVQETIVARQMALEVLGISVVTNMAAGIQSTPLSHEEVLESGRAVEAQLAAFLLRLVSMLANPPSAE